jgi:cytochrome c oxidase subunit 2
MGEPASRRRDDEARGRRAAVQVGGLVVATAVVVVPTLWVAGLGGSLGLPENVTAQGEDVIDLWRLLLVVATAIAMVVVVLFAVPLVRFRSRRSRRAGDEGDPPQTKGHVPLEVVYTAVPLLIVAGIFAVELRTHDRITDTGTPTMSIDVTGFQWGWRFAYPTGAAVVGTADRPPQLVLAAGRVVELRLHSPDVIHDFFVPGFLTKLDVIPGQDNRLVVTPTRTGTFIGHCAEFCGLDHARMNFSVRVLPAAEFDRWLQEQPPPAAPGASP